MTHALLSNSQLLRVTGTRALASAYRSSISGASDTKMRASWSFGEDGVGRRRSDRGRRAGGDGQHYRFGGRRPVTRWETALAGSRDAEGAGSGDDVQESGVSGVWAVQDEEEWEFEEEVQRLEERLERAVKNEDYKGAAKCRDELYRWVCWLFLLHLTHVSTFLWLVYKYLA